MKNQDDQTQKETPEEKRARLIAQLERGRQIAKERREAMEAAGLDPADYKLTQNGDVVQRKPSVKNLSKIVQEVLADPEWIDKVIKNQPDWWQGLPVKNAAYIMTTSMITMAMSGNLKAADWVRKTGFGEKVMIEAEDDSFFGKPDFTIKVINPTILDQVENEPPKHIEANASQLIEEKLGEELDNEIIDKES